MIVQRQGMKNKNISGFLLILFVAIQLAGEISSALSGPRDSLFNVFTIAVYLCLAGRMFIWLLVLRRMPLAAAYPFTALIYLLVLPLSFFLYGKMPSPGRIAGMFMMFGGILLCFYGSRLNDEKGGHG